MRRSPILFAIGLAAAAGACSGDRGPSGLDDRTYVTVMSDLLRFDQSRRARPRPPLPALSADSLAKDTTWKVARRADSLVQEAKDSASRAAILAKHGVTEMQLEATVRRLVDDTKRARALWDSVVRRAAEPVAPSANLTADSLSGS